MSQKESRLEALSAILEIAWADGTFDEREVAFIEKLVPAFGLTPADLELLPDSSRRPLAELLKTDAERRYVYEKAFKMSQVDGEFTPREHEALEKLRTKLGITPVQAAAIEGKVLGH